MGMLLFHLEFQRIIEQKISHYSHVFNDPTKCIVTGAGNALCTMFSRMTACEHERTQENEVNLALNGLRLRKYCSSCNSTPQAKRSLLVALFHSMIKARKPV